MEKKEIRKTIKNAVIGGATYGVLAAGAYGVHDHLTGADSAAASQINEEEYQKTVVVWSESQKYMAQTKFLKLIYAAYNNGHFKVNRLREVIDETYEKSKSDLGRMFDGIMHDETASVEIVQTEMTVQPAIVITFNYIPEKGTINDKFSKIRIQYHIGTKELTNKTIEKDVRIIAWQGYLEKENIWKDIKIPTEMEPTIKKKMLKPTECSYPRWNPKGVKYGFIDRGKMKLATKSYKNLKG